MGAVWILPVNGRSYMEQRETEQKRNGTNGIEMERILVWHGYHSPVSVGEGSFSQVYRVTDSNGGFRACQSVRCHRTMAEGM